jgi:hypothetical protein
LLLVLLFGFTCCISGSSAALPEVNIPQQNRDVRLTGAQCPHQHELPHLADDVDDAVVEGGAGGKAGRADGAAGGILALGSRCWPTTLTRQGSVLGAVPGDADGVLAISLEL